MKRAATVLVVCLAGLFISGTASAGGFLIYEHGAKGTGMAAARTASSDDVSALYYNPAAITELDGLQLELGMTGIIPRVHYEAKGLPSPPRTYIGAGSEEKFVFEDGTNSIDAESKIFTPIHVYASYRLPVAPVSVGFSLNNPFGLGTFWPENWDGRFIGTQTEIQTFFNQPVVAVDLADLFGVKDGFKLSIAGGYNFVYATAKLVKKIDLRALEVFFGDDPAAPQGEMAMTGDATGHGWNFAVYAEVPGIVAFGASVRSGVSLAFSGTAKFSFNETGILAKDFAASDIPAESTGEVAIDLPMNINLGVAVLAIDRLKIALDFYIAFFESYDELHLQFACEPADPENPQEGECPSLVQEPLEKNWGSSWQLSIGAEYEVIDHLFIRAGYGTVSTPVPEETFDPSLPDGHRHLICAGVGYQGSWWAVDLGYMLAIWSGEKNNTEGDWDNPEGETPLDKGNPNGMANGKYDTMAHLISLSLSAHFF